MLSKRPLQRALRFFNGYLATTRDIGGCLAKRQRLGLGNRHCASAGARRGQRGSTVRCPRLSEGRPIPAGSSTRWSAAAPRRRGRHARRGLWRSEPIHDRPPRLAPRRAGGCSGDGSRRVGRDPATRRSSRRCNPRRRRCCRRCAADRANAHHGVRPRRITPRSPVSARQSPCRGGSGIPSAAIAAAALTEHRGHPSRSAGSSGRICSIRGAGKSPQRRSRST
jgi:hypothetical protein